ncbi:MAG TPA: FUSC family protein [Rugosimonospora sp.]|nr:FUSC family protein [Rugosimonospora sp.]
MAPPTALAHRGQRSLSQLGQRSRATLSERLRRVRGSLLHAVQAGVAAGIAWYAAHDLLGHRTPFFAPISAVIVLSVSVGQRLRRAIELVVGVALGILVGDLLFFAIGTGPWQIATGVLLAIVTAVFLGGGAMLVNQAGGSAVLVATLAPPTHGIYYTRFLDALVGGTVGVLVMALLLPVNPLTLVKKAAGPVFAALADGLRDCAVALERRDREGAQAVLERLRRAEALLGHFRDALVTAREAATLSPARWRTRAPLAQYVDASVHVDRAVRNARVLARRAGSLLRDGEPVPPALPAATRTVAGAVGAFARELGAGSEPVRSRELCLTAVAQAGDAYRAGLGLSGTVVVAQIRSMALDLLRAGGVDGRVAERAVRRAAGKVPQPPRATPNAPRLAAGPG